MKYVFNLLILIPMISCHSYQISKYSKIEYEAGQCFGFCPIYKIIFNSDRSAILDAERFNFYEGSSREDYRKPKEGIYKSIVSADDYDKLISLANQAHFKELKDVYKDTRIADASINILTITSKDGTKKEITISAGEKPKNLEILVNYITDLKKNQKWEKIK